MQLKARGEPVLALNPKSGAPSPKPKSLLSKHKHLPNCPSSGQSFPCPSSPATHAKGFR